MRVLLEFYSVPAPPYQGRAKLKWAAQLLAVAIATGAWVLALMFACYICGIDAPSSFFVITGLLIGAVSSSVLAIVSADS